MRTLPFPQANYTTRRGPGLPKWFSILTRCLSRYNLDETPIVVCPDYSNDSFLFPNKRSQTHIKKANQVSLIRFVLSLRP